MGALRFYDQHPAPAQLLGEVVEGLRATPRRISPKFFYDQRGSELFKEICRLPEYYVTRTEMAILRACAEDVARRLGDDHVVVELGCGASDKARILLQAVRPRAYVPIDISRASLLACAEHLVEDHPAMEVHAICADYTQRVVMPSPVSDAPRLVFFPGSTLGNFDPGEAEDFLHRLRPLIRTDGVLLIGIDLKKDRAVLHRAYNDARGITAAFNLNLLVRIRRELDAQVDVSGFRHEAYYNEQEGRIEMHLISRRAQSIVINGDRFAFEEGAGICTEYSYKYSDAEFRALAARGIFVRMHVERRARAVRRLFFSYRRQPSRHRKKQPRRGAVTRALRRTARRRSVSQDGARIHTIDIRLTQWEHLCQA